MGGAVTAAGAKAPFGGALEHPVPRSGPVFRALVLPFFHPSMLYKLGEVE
jgi:hypothetical protein